MIPNEISNHSGSLIQFVPVVSFVQGKIEAAELFKHYTEENPTDTEKLMSAEYLKLTGLYVRHGMSSTLQTIMLIWLSTHYPAGTLPFLASSILEMGWSFKNMAKMMTLEKN